MPIGSGAMFTKVWQGFEQFRRLELTRGERPRLFGGQAEGCAPVATAFAEERRVSPVRPASRVSSTAIGNPADGELAIATARTSGGSIHAIPEDEVGANIELLAESAGVFGEGATGVALGALRTAAAHGELGEQDRVVIIVSGTGLKTPQLVSPKGGVVEIEADVDALLAEMGVTA
jgi:threonine synthase